MVKLKISEIAALMGLSANGVRKYEQYGIINPTVNDSTGHREYTGMNMGHLLSTRRYRQFGFSLEQIGDMLANLKLEEIELGFRQQAKQLEKEALYTQRRIQRLKEMASFISSVKISVNTYSIQLRPAMWLIPLNNFINLQNKFDIFKELSGNIPSVCISCVFSEPDNHQHYLSVYESDAILWELPLWNQVQVIPEQICVYTSMIQASETEQLHELYNGILEYLDKASLELVGDIITRGIVFINNSKQVYREVWIPIEKK